MERLNEILHELGISKVKLAKFLGVSRQMIYNYLELDDLSKWPKDKKVLLLNLLGIKSAEEIDKIKVDTDYILNVESRINSLFETTNKIDGDNTSLNGLSEKHKELLNNIIAIAREELDDPNDEETFKTYEYLFHFIQAMASSKETKYMLAYMAKATGYEKPLDFVYNEEEQFVFESIIYTAFILYNNTISYSGNGGVSKSKLAESHKRFVNQIEHKMEEKMSRTLELNTLKVQALKELGYTAITEENAVEVLAKIAEIESRVVN